MCSTYQEVVALSTQALDGHFLCGFTLCSSIHRFVRENVGEAFTCARDNQAHTVGVLNVISVCACLYKKQLLTCPYVFRAGISVDSMYVGVIRRAG